MKTKLAARFDSCTRLRTFKVKTGTLNLATGQTEMASEEWRTQACGVPLFGEDQKAGICKSCAAGWTHPNNYPAEQGSVSYISLGSR